MSSSRISVLLNWCADNGVQIDSRIQVIESSNANYHPGDGDIDIVSVKATDKSPGECGFGVYSCEESIGCGCTLVYIPKTVALSVKSCFLSQEISPVPHGHGAHLSLALALYGELLRGPNSRWFGYLQSLPRETVDIAMFWGASDVISTGPCICPSRGCYNALSGDRDRPAEVTWDNEPDVRCPTCVRLHDGQNAKAWLDVTDADVEQVGLVDEVRQYYFNVVEATLSAAFNNPRQLKEDDPSVNKRLEAAEGHRAGASPKLHGVSFSGFCHAYSLVSTRAFWVDAYHGLAMVPIADVFNHSNDNHLHMESDYDVCVECGSLAECEHDREAESSIAPPFASNVHPLSQNGVPSTDEIDYLEMRTLRPVPPHSELYNTYGSLSNAALLSRYGFVLPENEHDTVKMVFDPLTSVVNMFMYAARKEPLVDDDASHSAVMQPNDFGRIVIRNRLREGAVVDYSSAAAEPLYDKGPHTNGRGMMDDLVPIPSSSVGGNKISKNLTISNLGEESTDMIQAMANRLLRMFAYITRVWNADEAWDEHDDGLVFNPASPRPVSFLLADGPMQVNHDFVVNSDGKLSHNLWLLCGLVALFSARPHLDSTFFGLLEWAESGREVITALTELKARLVHIQGYVERLCHLHDRESVGDDMEDTGDSSHGSTSYSLSFPHSVSSHSSTDNDPESDGFAQPPTAGQVQPRPSLEPRDTFTHLSITSAKGSRTPDVSKPKLAMAQLLGTGPQDPRTSFSLPASQALSQLFQIPVIEPPSQLHAARQSYQETPKTVTTTQPSQATVSSSRRARSRSAEGEWPSKRVRRCSDSVVVNHEGSQLNRLTRATVKFGTACQLLDAHEPATEDDAVITGPDHYAALLLARIVMGLCYGRYRPPALKNGQRGIGMTAADLGELLDETPDCMPRTRSALLLATSERSIVESCAASWGAILEK